VTVAGFAVKWGAGRCDVFVTGKGCVSEISRAGGVVEIWKFSIGIQPAFQGIQSSIAGQKQCEQGSECCTEHRIEAQ
jgi:hypothetical protein